LGVDSLFQDIRYAVRTLRRTPLFTVTVAATMGLGLGLVGSAFWESSTRNQSPVTNRLHQRDGKHVAQRTTSFRPGTELACERPRVHAVQFCQKWLFFKSPIHATIGAC
jgi:hypothetical protein